MDFRPYVVTLILLVTGPGFVHNACHPTRFGEGCRHRCNCIFSTDNCNSTTGECPNLTCRPGYFHLNCSVRMARMDKANLCALWMTNVSMNVQFRQWDSSMEGDGPVEGYRIRAANINKPTHWETKATIPHLEGWITSSIIVSVQPGVIYQWSITAMLPHHSYSLPSTNQILMGTRSDVGGGMQEVPDSMKCKNKTDTPRAQKCDYQQPTGLSQTSLNYTDCGKNTVALVAGLGVVMGLALLANLVLGICLYHTCKKQHNKGPLCGQTKETELQTNVSYGNNQHQQDNAMYDGDGYTLPHPV